MRTLSGPVGWIATVIAAGLTAYQLYTVRFGFMDPLMHRATHLVFVLVLAFLLYPATRKSPRDRITALDILFALGSIAAWAYLVYDYERISSRLVYASPVAQSDIIFGILAILVVLEACRRAVGWQLSLIALIAFLYPILGPWKFRLSMVIEQMFLIPDGIFGVPLGVAASEIFPFVLFAGFLERSGLGESFMALASALTGRSRGGPAKIAVLSSALFGTISGAAVANVYTTGSFTIPLMRRIGYRPAFAGAVEAAASTGGQLMPPVMGAAVFVMANYLGIPYTAIMKMALFPAILYFLSIGFMVHLEALKSNLQGMPEDQIPDLRQVLKDTIHLWIPVGVLIALLAFGYSPATSAVLATLSVPVSSWLRKHTRMSLAAIADCFVSGARKAVVVSTACAAAGIVVGIIFLTGIAMTFASSVLAISQGIAIVALVIVALAALVLGMGVPTTPAYIMAALVAVPALSGLGIDIKGAHMFVFFFAVLAPVTPPVALASYAAAQIAEADLMETGYTGFRLAAAAFILPFMFVFNPALLLNGSAGDIILAIISALVGCYSLAGALTGWLVTRTTALERILLALAGVVLIHPGLLTDLIGLAILAVCYLYQRAKVKVAAPVEGGIAR